MKKLIAGVVAVSISAVVAGCGSGGGGKGHFGASTGAAVGTTVVAGSLVDARSQHTATALADGARVLIAGGETLRGTPTDTLELWEAGRSQPLFEQLRTARAGHVAALLRDGRVWIAGGHDVSGKALRSTEIWDPVARTVTPGPDLAAPRDRAALLVGRAVFFISGGGAPSLEQWRDDLSETLKIDGAPVRFGGGIASLRTDTVVIAGGVDAQGRPVAPVSVRNLEVTKLPGERFVEGGLPVNALLDGKTFNCFIVGGRFGPDGKHAAAIQDVSVRDTEPTFAKQKLLVARERHTVVQVARGFVVAGGLLSGRAEGQVERIDDEGSSFAASLSAPRYDLVATFLPGLGGAVLFTGGLGDDGRQVGLTELLLPPGASLDGSALFARARDEEATRLRLVAERDAAVADAARLTTELQTTQQELAAERTLRAQREQELAAARARAASLEASLASTQAQLAAARSDVAQRQASLDQQTTRVAQLEAALATAQQAAAAQQARADQLQGQLATSQSQLGATQAQLAAAQAAATPKPGFQVGAVTVVTGLPKK